jgi:hypothetical protein
MFRDLTLYSMLKNSSDIRRTHRNLIIIKIRQLHLNHRYLQLEPVGTIISGLVKKEPARVRSDEFNPQHNVKSLQVESFDFLFLFRIIPNIVKTATSDFNKSLASLVYLNNDQTDENSK